MTLFDPQPQSRTAAAQDPIVPCQRCGVLLAFRPKPPTPGARIMRHAQRPKGVCATCGFRLWLASDYGGALEEIVLRDCGGDASVLKLPHVQEQIRQVMEVGKCDAPFEEIDFDRLRREWDLPLEGSPRGKGSL